MFGPEGGLVGVMTEPVGGSSQANRTACIFLNAGLVHHVGPNRMYVRLARQVASLGYPSLRFDLSNRGDSDARRDGLSFLAGGVADLRLAMDLMHKTLGVERFVLLGICSGAINSLYAATVEPRVVGAVSIDGPVYRTFGHYLRRFTRRVFNARTLRNTLTGRNTIGRLFTERPARVPRAEGEFAHLYADVTLPTRDESNGVLCSLVDRGTRLLFIYTGSWSIYNYENQFRDAFPDLMKRGATRVVYAPDADHTFTRLYHQQRLLDIVSGWLIDSFGTVARDADRAESDERTSVG